MKKEFELLEDNLDKIIATAERNVIREYQKTLKAIKAEIAEIYEKYGEPTLVDLQKYDRINKLDKKMQEEINKLYVTNRSLINTTLRDSYIGAYAGTKAIIEGESKKTLRAIVKPVNVTKTINEEMAGLKWADRVSKHRSDLIYDVQAVIKQGLQRGDSYSTMAKELNKKIIEITPKGLKGDVSKSTTIVRTESQRVTASAKKEVIDVAKSQGIDLTKTWNSVEDERVRDSHVKMDGQTVPYDGMYTLPTGEKVVGPHLTGIAKEDCNCRCFESYELA
jgi:hypothetical protein